MATAPLAPGKRRTTAPLGSGLILETSKAGRSYVWRAKVKGPNGWMNVQRRLGSDRDMTKSEAKRVARSLSSDAAKGIVDVAPAKSIKTAVTTQSLLPPIATQAGMSVDAAWALYMAREGSKKRTAAEKQSFYHRWVKPAWGHRPVTSITKTDCYYLLVTIRDHVLARAQERGGGTGAYVNRCQAKLGRFFHFCARDEWMATGLEASPMGDLARLVSEDSVRDRPLSARELGWLFRALQELRREDEDSARAYELLLRSVRRRDEIFTMQWGWIQGDRFEVPTEYNKSKKPHVYYWHPAMAALVGDRPGDAEHDTPVWGVGKRTLCGRVWPSGRAHGSVRLRQLMTQIAAQDGFNGDFLPEYLDGERNPHYWRAHDFRATAHTYLGGVLDEHDRQIFPADLRERLLGHVIGGSRAHYDKHEAYAEKKAALLEWNRYLDECATG